MDILRSVAATRGRKAQEPNLPIRRSLGILISTSAGIKGAYRALAGASYGEDRFDQTVYDINNWRDWYSSRKDNKTEYHGGKDKSYALYVQDKWAISSEVDELYRRTLRSLQEI